MRIVFFVFVLLHGLLHLLGFVKAFNLLDIKALSQPIAKPFGLFWLFSALLLLLYGAMFLTQHRSAWVVGTLGVLISQILIFWTWKEAKFGSLPNVVILIMVVIAFGQFRFQQRVSRETAVILKNNSAPHSNDAISADDIRHLPAPVQRWMHKSGVVGKAPIHTGIVRQTAMLKLKPEQKDWSPAVAVQYTTIDEPAFIWSVDVKMNTFINFNGRDKFELGKGEMLIKLFGLIAVVNEKGDKLSEASLQRFLGEMAWFPSMALSPYIHWEERDAYSAMATMQYMETEGRGTFFFNESGDFTKFSAQRYMGNKPEDQRFEWVIEVDEYDTFNEITVPSKMRASWMLERGPWTWLHLEVNAIHFNKTPPHYDEQ